MGLTKVDIEEAQRMLDTGAPVLRIAFAFEVAPQAIYDLIRRGRLVRRDPQTAPAA